MIGKEREIRETFKGRVRRLDVGTRGGREEEIILVFLAG